MCHYVRDEMPSYEFEAEDELVDEDAAEEDVAETTDEERRPVAPSADD